MNEAITVALISSAASLVGIILSNKYANDEMAHRLDTAVKLLQADNNSLKADVKEHNNYAKMFAETMPVIKEQIKVINHRIEDLEKKVG